MTFRLNVFLREKQKPMLSKRRDRILNYLKVSASFDTDYKGEGTNTADYTKSTQFTHQVPINDQTFVIYLNHFGAADSAKS